MESRIFVDGRITAPEDAVVPVLDRGFLYGDSVYEVLWWHRGRPIQRREHIDRLVASGRRLYMDLEADREAFVAAIEATVEAAGVGPHDDAYVRLVVTRGRGRLGLAFDAETPRTLVVMVAPAGRPTPAHFEQGLRVAVVPRLRNPRAALDPAAKTGNYLNNLLALHEARLAGADEALMLNEAGNLTEATTANVYLVQEGVLVTPSLEAGILEGTTRMRILALARDDGIEVAERDVEPADLEAADEILLSSSVKGIRPVVAVGERPVGDGRPGPLTRRLHALFEAAADAEAEQARDVQGEGPDAGRHPPASPREDAS